MNGVAGREATAVLRRLIRFDTVNPPGDEAAAQAWLGGHLAAAGLEVELAGEDPARPNLVARLRGREPGPVLGLLSHMDTVGAEPGAWRHGPWSGALADGCVWGRGALDMKSQTAAEAVAACTLAREGWRPARGDLVVICVADEEVGGTGAEWLCAQRPDLARCDWLINEGAGAAISYGDTRLHGVAVAEKGIFRFTLTTDGVAGHASLPTIADNALLKLAPVLEAIGARRPGWDVTPGPRAMLDGLVDGGGSIEPQAALDAVAAREPRLAKLIEPMLRVTLSPTMVDASRQMNVIPAAARLHVDCRVPPGMDQAAVEARLREVLDGTDARLAFTDRMIGNQSPVDTPLMDALRGWVERIDPAARCLPTITAGYSDSRTFRDAFPECVAYGFFPHRHQTLEETAALVHSHDERIDVRDLALATDCYRDIARALLG